jgi:NAD+ synthase
MNNKLSKKITQWIVKYAASANKNVLVVGVSGGVDSALTSTLCAKTGLKTIVVSLPIHQKYDQLSRAKKHIDWLIEKYPNVISIEKDLTNLFESFKLTMGSVSSDLALANSRSRLRMVTLYQVAQVNDGLVVGTGNKVEDFGVGFFTKYGDGGVDISPIADLMKSQVVNLAIHLGILEEVAYATPTDGLWDEDRTDEEQLGVSYSELEWAMQYNGEEKINAEKERILSVYYRLNKANKHKMMPIPVCKI